MYTENSIDRVRDADILTVIGHYVQLKRAGSLYEASSPFNPSDKTPSFKVSPSKNNWVDYSTQFKGDGIKFVMLKEPCNFPEAVKKIADICGITMQEEAVTEDVQRRRDNKAEMHRVMENVATEYRKQLGKLNAEHWALKLIARRGISPEIAAQFGIGYAPAGGQFITGPIIEAGKLEPAKSAGIIQAAEGRSYDFFRDRITFPVEDVNGNVVAFGGRRADEAEGPKYINSKETEIYSKSKVLYGLFQAKKRIQAVGAAILVEGYTDVTGLHQYGCDIAVASGGTALTGEQARQLKRFAPQVILCRDNDGYKANGDPGAGTMAMLRDIDILLSEGLRTSVVILPEGEDPDSFAKKYIEEATEDTAQLIDYMIGSAQDAILWKAEWLKNHAANDDYKVSEAVQTVAQMLFAIKDDIVRKRYADKVAKIFKVKIGTFGEKFADMQKKVEEKAEKSGVLDQALADELGLPEGADYAEFVQKGFCTIGSAYWFPGREGFFMATNYTITPLFHVAGNVENKRLCEVVNINGEKRLVDLESKDFVNKSQFETKMMDLGYFIFTSKFDESRFRLLKQYILRDFISANEIADLGWQDQGFFAYADCVYHEGNIKKVNNYGIIQLDTPAKKNSDYHAQSTYYYLPAYSEMHRYDNSSGDQYENDRFCVYRPTEITLNQWMAQLHKVYGDKAVLGIAFCFASVFRDLFIKMYQYFPHMFLSGEKGSGKSKFGESLAAIFTYKQPAFDLNAGTPVAFYRRLARYANALSLFEEYHDNIDLKLFQSMKGAADGRGREMGKASGDNKTISTKVNCALIILGQYLSARDDNSLTTRSVLGHFIKRMDPYTTEDIENYAKLKSWEEQGMNALLTEILQHRNYVEKNLHERYREISKKMKTTLEKRAYEQRVLDTYITLLTPMELLWDKFQFPFKREAMWTMFTEAVTDSSDLIVESEGLAQFWQILQYFLERKPFPLIAPGNEFKIDVPATLTIQTKKGEADIIWQNNNRRRVLLLRLNAVHQLYHKEAITRGVDVISENTMKNYFRSKKYFIGSVKSHRFDGISTSAYCFDYDLMEESGIVNLIRNAHVSGGESGLFDETKTNGAEDDVPY